MDTLYLVFADPFVQMVEAPSFFAEVIIGGLMSGVMYSLVALGFVLIFKASGVFNFAQGVLALFAALTLVGLMTGTMPVALTPFPGVALPAWLAIIVTAAVMIGLAYIIERVVLRPLVNQDPIILFMSTIGLAFVLEGVGDILWGSEVKPLDVGIPTGHLMLGEVRIEVFEIWAAVTAGVLVVVLAVFFQKTRVGRALRAVADDHQAAMSVGIPLNAIWVVVWSVAGIVALVAGIMWGVQKRRPVLAFADRVEGAAGADLGRIYIRARGHCRRPDHRCRRKGWRKFTGVRWSTVRSRTGSPIWSPWFSCCSGRRDCSAKRSSRGSNTMIYREAGQFKTSYQADEAIFPIAQDRWFIALMVAVGYVAVPLLAGEYLLQAILIPVLIFSMAAIGLNILTGYCGQLSLGTGGFMAVGAIACYKFTTAFPELNLIVVFLLSGLVTAGVGLIFGIPSLRIKGFYLAVATLAAQFFLSWLFNKVAWFVNYAPSGTITMPARDVLGVQITGAAATPLARYVFVLSAVIAMAFIAKNLVRGPVGRAWMAIRDMDIAAEIIGFRPFKTKLVAFCTSSFFVGISGAMLFAIWLGSVETAEAFDINVSFQVLFMIIIGGLGSILGSFMGAAFIVIMPIALNNVMVQWLAMEPVTAKHLEFVLFGGLIIFFLIVEPLGLARFGRSPRRN